MFILPVVYFTRVVNPTLPYWWRERVLVPHSVGCSADCTPLITEQCVIYSVPTEISDVNSVPAEHTVEMSSVKTTS